MAAARSSKMLLPVYQITRHHIPEDSKFLEKIRWKNVVALSKDLE
jgi:hypothetical protein